MLGRQKVMNMNSVLLFLGVCCCLVPTSWLAMALSDKRLCADPKCQEIISLGTAKLRYTAAEEGVISFNIHSPIRIKSKSAGNDPSLWGVEINGREGYAPKEFIVEQKVFISDKNLKHIVAVVPPGNTASKSVAAAALKASENIAELKADAELTTTAPLMVPTIQLESKEVPSVVPSMETLEDKPETATPVQQKTEVIDGTAIPILEESIMQQTVDTQTAPPKASETTTKVEELVLEGVLGTETSNVDNEEVNANENEVGSDGEEDEDDDEDDENDDDDNEQDEHENENDSATKEILNTGSTIAPKVEASLPSATPTTLNEKNATLDTQESIEHSEEKPTVVESKSMDKQEVNSENDNTLTNNAKPEKEIEIETVQQENALQSKDASATQDTHMPDNKVNEDETTLANNDDDIVMPIGLMQTISETIETIESDPGIVEKDKQDNTLKEAPINSTDENSGAFQMSHNESVKEQIKESDVVTTPTSSGAVTTEPTVTESGYLHHVDPRDLYEFDTTTMPTIIATPQSVNEQAPESDNSSIPETTTNTPSTTTSVIEESSQIVPILQPKPQSETENVPKEKENEAAQDVVHLNTFKDLPTTVLTPASLESPEFQVKVNDIASPADQTPSSLPVFRQPAQQLQYHNNAKHETHSPADNDRYQKPDQLYTVEKIEASKQQSLNDETSSDTNSKHTERNINVKETKPQTSEPLQEDPPAEEVQLDVSPESNSVDHGGSVTDGSVSVGVGSFDAVRPLSPNPENEPVMLPAQIPPAIRDMPDGEKKENGLFATILGTVNSFLSNVKKETFKTENDFPDEELQRILYPDRIPSNKKSTSDEPYCEKLSPNDCPTRVKSDMPAGNSHISNSECTFDLSNLSLDMVLTVAANKVLEMSELLACLAIASATCLFFLFVYYCFCNSSREGALLSRLNALERSLLATQKENAILKQDLLSTRSKLSSIEDNSFGSNDMVMALRKELEEELLEKHQLQEQVSSLEKELENAAEAGLELNKIVSELLNNQTGDESIISSVEELQRQLNEQQKTILDINANLAEKSRENSELQLMIAEQNARLSGEIASLQQDNDELETEKGNLQTKMEEIKQEFEENITKALEGKNYEIKRLQNEVVELTTKWEVEHTKLQTSFAKVEALEECLRAVRRDPNVNINKVIDVANVRAEFLDIQKKYTTLKERLDVEADERKLAEEHLKVANASVEKLKLDFHQSEKDKLEAQTRLEVLSNYFKEKETQLQKELSLKEAMWLKQQGETTSTVDRLTTMQEEIQSLKSQNDALRAEIEAQLAAHKAQTGTLENRAHETWLAAKQSERRCEEARAEATALRRKLTALAGGTEVNFDKMGSGEFNNAPSPIHLEPAGSPLLSRLPPPPFLPPPFMGPPPPFMGMPPPFVQPGEMRPPPLGRLMSPPPGAGSGGSGGSGHLPPRSGRYSPNRMDYYNYEDDDDDDDDDDDEEEEDYEEKNERHRRRRRSNVNGSWDRDDSYSPARGYRSRSPEDSRYNYTGTYDAETDFSPPPSPHQRRARGSRAGSYKAYSPPPSASSPLNASSSSGVKKTSSSAINKGHASSESEKSFKAPRHSKKGGKLDV